MININKTPKSLYLTSAAFCLRPRDLAFYSDNIKKKPVLGDVIIGQITSIGQHSKLENKSGRIHNIHRGTIGIFVFGSRYAPDHYEAVLPKKLTQSVDLIARSGLVGKVRMKNSLIKQPTRVKVLGYLTDKDGNVINTTDKPTAKPKQSVKKAKRSKMILVCGTSMNSGKSYAAANICQGLSLIGKKVRGSKVTGTASLKDILNMEDMGAEIVSDFTYLGYPSTYMLAKRKLMKIFDDLDLKYANNPSKYWVVELADGILQRETAMLIQDEDIRKRIHKLVFCATDAFSMIGGLSTLKNKFNLRPDVISGLCTVSPLHIMEFESQNDENIPILDSSETNIDFIKKHLL